MCALRRLFDLSGKTAMITGGSRGLGLQIAEALGEQGARVVISARTVADLKDAQSHLKSLGIEADWIAADGQLKRTSSAWPMRRSPNYTISTFSLTMPEPGGGLRQKITRWKPGMR